MVCEAVTQHHPTNTLYLDIIEMQQRGLLLREIADVWHTEFSTVCQIVMAHLRKN